MNMKTLEAIKRLERIAKNSPNERVAKLRIIYALREMRRSCQGDESR